MGYSLKKILEVVSKEKTFGDKFLFYDKKEKVCCYNFWCYDIEEKKVKISDINYCENCNDNRKKTDEQYIVVENNDSNMIISGYDKYDSLKKSHNKNKLITVLSVTKIKKIDFMFMLKNILFRVFILSPLKILYKSFKLLKK